MITKVDKIKQQRKDKQTNRISSMNQARWKRRLTFVMLVAVMGLFTACGGQIYKVKGPDKSNNLTDSQSDSVINSTPEKTTTTELGKTETKSAHKKDEQKKPQKTIEKEIEKEESTTNQVDNKQLLAKFKNQFEKNDTYNLSIDLNELSTESQSWSFKRNKDHQPVKGYYKVDLTKYGAYYRKTMDEPVMYLTFDEGYENGYTPMILDALKKNDVHACFFVTKYFIDKNPELIKRMLEEGHLIGSHSATHPDFSKLTEEQVYQELDTTAKAYTKLTGQPLAPFFRYPMGKYSEKTLYLTRKLGYRTIFWSMAHRDWETNNQPGVEVAYQHVIDNAHYGAIILLHAVSQSNAEALDRILQELKEQGYRFGSLYELEG